MDINRLWSGLPFVSVLGSTRQTLRECVHRTVCNDLIYNKHSVNDNYPLTMSMVAGFDDERDGWWPDYPRGSSICGCRFFLRDVSIAFIWPVFVVLYWHSWRDRVAPLLCIGTTSFVAISTLTSDMNFYTKLISKMDPLTNIPVFKSIQIQLACQACIDAEKAHECVHLQHLIPRWQVFQTKKVCM